MKEEKVYLTLQNGRVFEGKRFGARGDIVGELVFTTGMTGYIETLTDPSYYGQIVIQTFPLIGNYGVIPQGGAEAGEIRAFNLEDGSERVVLTLPSGHCAEELEEKGGKIFYLDVWYDGGEQYVATCLRPAGDLNGDGATDLLDALALARHLAGQRSISAEDFAAAGVQAPNSVADVLNMLIAQKAA